MHLAALPAQIVGEAVDVGAYLLGGVIKDRRIFAPGATDLMLSPIFFFVSAGNAAVAVFYLHDEHAGSACHHQVHFAFLAPVSDGGILQAEIALRQILQKRGGIGFSLDAGFQRV